MEITVRRFKLKIKEIDSWRKIKIRNPHYMKLKLIEKY
jgi:hypothetical protein